MRSWGDNSGKNGARVKKNNNIVTYDVVDDKEHMFEV
jgi:hypothetical protein